MHAINDNAAGAHPASPIPTPTLKNANHSLLCAVADKHVASDHTSKQKIKMPFLPLVSANLANGIANAQFTSKKNAPFTNPVSTSVMSNSTANVGKSIDGTFRSKFCITAIMNRRNKTYLR